MLGESKVANKIPKDDISIVTCIEKLSKPYHVGKDKALAVSVYVVPIIIVVYK